MRIKRGNVCRNRHKKILKLAKGFKGARSRIFKVANIAVMKALKYAYRDRRATKRNISYFKDSASGTFKTFSKF